MCRLWKEHPGTGKTAMEILAAQGLPYKIKKAVGRSAEITPEERDGRGVGLLK